MSIFGLVILGSYEDNKAIAYSYSSSFNSIYNYSNQKYSRYWSYSLNLEAFAMNLDEFKTRYREVTEQSSNHLQISTILLSQLEDSLSSIGENLQTLSREFEELVIQQRAE